MIDETGTEANWHVREWRIEKVRSLNRKHEEQVAIWQAEEALNAEFEAFATQVMRAWNETFLSPDDYGYSLAEARVLLSLEFVTIIVKAEAEDLARQWYRDFPARDAEGRLMTSAPESHKYAERSQGLILHSLRIGDLVATGFDFRDPTKRVRISRDSWNALMPDFKHSAARTAAFEYLGIRVEKADKPALPKPPPVGEGRVTKWLETQKAAGRSFDPDDERPNAEKCLGGSISRDKFREVYASVYGRKARGRPRKDA